MAGELTPEGLRAIEERHKEVNASAAHFREQETTAHEDRGLLLAEVRRLRECLTRLTTGADCPACGHPYWRHRDGRCTVGPGLGGGTLWRCPCTAEVPRGG